MQALLKLSRAIDALNAFVGKYVIWLILLATAVRRHQRAGAQDFCRTSSITFLEKRSGTCLPGLSWWQPGLPCCTASMYALTCSTMRLPKRVQVWIDIVGFALNTTPLCIAVLYLSWPLVVQMYQTGEMSGNPGGLVIRWPYWAALPVGFTLLMLQG